MSDHANKAEASDGGNQEDKVVDLHPATPHTDNILNLDEFSLDQDYAKMVGVKRLITTVRVRRPKPVEFVRVNPDPNYRKLVALVEHTREEGGNGEYYLVHGPLADALRAEKLAFPFMLHATINRQRVLSLWPIRLPGEDGKDNDYWRTAREAAAQVETVWAKVVANQALGAYETTVAPGNIPEPVWPDITFAEMMTIGFRNKVITDLNHQLIDEKRGLR